MMIVHDVRWCFFMHVLKAISGGNIPYIEYFHLKSLHQEKIGIIFLVVPETYPSIQSIISYIFNLISLNTITIHILNAQLDSIHTQVLSPVEKYVSEGRPIWLLLSHQNGRKSVGFVFVVVVSCVEDDAIVASDGSYLLLR